MKLPNLKKAREIRGHTLRTLAEASNVMTTTICNIELDKADTTPPTARKLATALNFEVWQLVSDKEDDLMAQCRKEALKK